MWLELDVLTDLNKTSALVAPNGPGRGKIVQLRKGWNLVHGASSTLLVHNRRGIQVLGPAACDCDAQPVFECLITLVLRIAHFVPPRNPAQLDVILGVLPVQLMQSYVVNSMHKRPELVLTRLGISSPSKHGEPTS